MPAPVLPGIFRGIVSLADPVTRAGRYSYTLDFYPTPGGSTVLADLAGSLASIVKSFYETPATSPASPLITLMHDDFPVSGHQVEVFELEGPSAPSAIETFDIVGTRSTGEPLPAEVALVMTKRTAGRGRRFRGRAYLGSFSESANAVGRPSQPLIDIITEQANTFLTGTEQPGELNFVVSSAGNGTSVPATASLITRWDVDNSWDSQRRRGFR